MKISLVMPCPACTHERNFYSEIWSHAGCGGVLCIDEHAIVYCKACGKKAHITKMYMSCDKHKYVKPTKKLIKSAIASGKMSDNFELLSWLIKLLKNI